MVRLCAPLPYLLMPRHDFGRVCLDPQTQADVCVWKNKVLFRQLRFLFQSVQLWVPFNSVKSIRIPEIRQVPASTRHNWSFVCRVSTIGAKKYRFATTIRARATFQKLTSSARIRLLTTTQKRNICLSCDCSVSSIHTPLSLSDCL